jgi:hypothetical protein
LVYYSKDRIPGERSELASLVEPFLRARRAYYARRRKPLKVQIPGPERTVYRDGQAPPAPPIVIEKEVPRFIDRIILIPRFGIRFPVYLNNLFHRNDGSETNPAISNVMAFGKRGA